MELRVSFLKIVALISLWTIPHTFSVCDFNFNVTYGSYTCQEKDNIKTCKASCEVGEFSSPPAEKYTCNLTENKWYPAEVPICGHEKWQCNDGFEFDCKLQDDQLNCPKLIENKIRYRYPHSFCSCHCSDSKLLNSEDKCVPKHQCGCEFKDRKYNVGEKIKFGSINQCTCLKSGWICSNNTASCLIWGGTHYITFDGKKFDFMGKCSYYLLKTDSFSIAGNNMALQNGKFIERDLADDEYKNLRSATLSVTICMNGYILTLGRDNISQLIINENVIKNVPYYHRPSGIWIQKESHNSLTANLPNGIKVSYQDRKCFIHIPSDFNLEHGGLCGTLNGNSNDNFQKSDGTLTDNVNEFGNSWKTEMSCPNAPQNFIHPCNGNPIRKAQARIKCELLKSQIFENCSANIPVNSFYEACIYDMCACGDNVEDCLCSAIQSYNDECTRANVLITWRSHMHECKPKCPNEMVWNTCNNPCELSCRNREDWTCVKSCVSGCACPEGKTEDEEGKCIPINQCKCQMEKVYYNPGTVKIFKFRICTCLGPEWKCNNSSDDNLKNHCAKRNMTLADCYYLKQKTCQNALLYENDGNDPDISKRICHNKGCICNNGTVLNPLTDLCVPLDSCPKCSKGKTFECDEFMARQVCPASKRFPPVSNTKIGKEWCGCHCNEDTVLNNYDECVPINQCNCLKDNKWYKPNETISDCTCERGQWNCSEKTASCTWNNDRYKTFDDKKFMYIGKCSYYLVKTKDYSIEGNYVPWKNGKIVRTNLTFQEEENYNLQSMALTVTIRMNNSVITMGKYTVSELIINEEDINTFPYTDWKSGITIRKESDNKLAAYLQNGIKVTYAAGKWIIMASAPFEEQHGGICGSWNKDPSDDAKKPGGEHAMNFDDFFHSWKIDKSCNDNDNNKIQFSYYLRIPHESQANEKCKILKSNVFANCHAFIDVDNYYQDCLYISSCNEEVTNCLCPAIQNYADDCGFRNISINWRSAVKECQIQCPKGLVYNSCSNPCERNCDEIAADTPCISSCVAGCGCPKGQTFDRDGKTCIAIEQCECREDDKLLPVNSSKVTNLHGDQQICTCKKGKWSCQKGSNKEAKKVCNKSNKVLVDCIPIKEKTCINLNETKVTLKECYKGCACAKVNVWDEKTHNCISKTNCPQCSKDKFISCNKNVAFKVCPGASQFIPNPNAQKNEEWCGCHCTGNNVLNNKGKCVPKYECLCFHNGQWFNPAERIQIGDNACLCENGKWKCSQNTETCTAWGAHYTSFDGNNFDFTGKCSYYLIRSTGFSIEGNNIAWKNGKIVSKKLTDAQAKYYASTTLSITIKIKYEEITLGRDQMTQLIVNGNEIKEFPYINDIAGVTVRKEGDTLLAAYLPNGIKVTYSRRKWNIITPQNFSGTYEGLCGILNRNPKDDFTKPDGTIADDINEFGNAWKTDSSCANAFNDNRHPCDKNFYQKAYAISKCNILKENIFQNCYSFVDVQAYYEGCLYDTCSCSNNINDCPYTAIQSYADECTNYKIAIDWKANLQIDVPHIGASPGENV